MVPSYALMNTSYDNVYNSANFRYNYKNYTHGQVLRIVKVNCPTRSYVFIAVN